MDTYSGSNDSAYGLEPQDQWIGQDTASLAASFGDYFADQTSQAPQAGPTFDVSEYYIPSPSFPVPQEVVPMHQAVAPLPQIVPQEYPEVYNPDLDLWYNAAPGPVTGAHYNRKIGWHYPMPAPDTMPQGPALTGDRAPIAAPLTAQFNFGRPGRQLTPARAPAPKARNPKKNSIIQRCICKPQYSTIDIPRPPNQFLCFRNQESMRVQQEAEVNEGVKIRHDEISKRVAFKWNAMTPEQKAPYKAQADRLAREHKARYPDYVFKPGVKAAHQFGSMSCTCGAFKINMAAREKREALGKLEPPLKKKGGAPSKKFATEPETLSEYESYASTPTLRKRKQRDEENDDQPAPKRSARTKTPIRYTEIHDENDSLFMTRDDEEMADAPFEDDDSYPLEVAAPVVLALPPKGRRSPPAPIMTIPASPALTRSARKEPTPLKTGSLDSLFDFDGMLDYNAPFVLPTSAPSSKKSAGRGSVAPVTPRRSTRLSGKEAL